MGKKFPITANPQWFDAKKAEDIIAKPPRSSESDDLMYYVGLMKITQGPMHGKRLSEVILPWQERLVRWIPHVAELAVKCGKGSGKSVLVAGIALGMVMRWVATRSHKRGLVVIMAANIDSANIVFGHIYEAILADDHLKNAFKSNARGRSLTHKESGIVIQVIPPRKNRAVGLRPGLLLVDELHEAAAVTEFDDVLRQLILGGQNWPDFTQISITTAPIDRGKGYYVEWLTRARAVRDGKVKNPRLLPALFEFPVLERPDIEPEDEKYWYFGMPSLITRKGGKGTMDASAMRMELDDATQDLNVVGSGAFQNLLSQRLGIEMEERQGGGLTLLAEFWGGNAVNRIPDIYDGLYVACDPSEGLNDPFAVVTLTVSGRMMYVKSRQWVTQEGYDRAPNVLKRIYDEAIAAGELFVRATDEEIEADVHAYCRSIEARSLITPMFGGDALGLAGFKQRFESTLGTYVAVPQNWQLMASFMAAQGAAHAGRLKHLDQPLLSRNVSNLRIEGRQFLKADANIAKAGIEKIDGTMAMLSAIHMKETQPLVVVESMIG